MGITNILKSKQYQDEINRLAGQNQQLNSILTLKSNELEKLTSENQRLNTILFPKTQEIDELKQQKIDVFRQIQNLNQQKNNISQELKNYEKIKESLKSEIEALKIERKQKEAELIPLDDALLYQDFGLYTPMYNLMNSEAYKDRISVIRAEQKSMIKDNTAAYFSTFLTYNNSRSQGNKLVSDNVKQILRAFNNECEAIISKVKFNNVESIRKRINKSYDDLNKLNAKMQVSISPKYLDLKLQEMNLCYEYEMKKQEEKEEQKRIREEQKEYQKLQHEIEEARKSSQKEKAHYQNALHRVEVQMQSVSGTELTILEEQRAEIEQQLHTIENEMKQIDYREANQRAGYVYIISNIGSFGENIYKIGMTRRLNPMDRVDELGDASVPFKFDVHAMIFSEDAPALETALHKAFDDKKVNMVNTRREFFHVTLEEIEEVVRKNFDNYVEFTKLPNAEQYRESEMIRRKRGLNPLTYQTADVINQDTTPLENTAPESTPPKKYLHTKWGTYEMPEKYVINFKHGERHDLTRIDK